MGQGSGLERFSKAESVPFGIRIATAQHQGARARQEDALTYQVFAGRRVLITSPIDGKKELVVAHVAIFDGMGGHRREEKKRFLQKPIPAASGHDASQKAVDVFTREHPIEPHQLPTTLYKINQEIFQGLNNYPQLTHKEHVGTTGVELLVTRLSERKYRGYFVAAGDSGALKVRRKRNIEQLTVADAREKVLPDGRRKSVLTRSLGTKPNLDILDRDHRFFKDFETLDTIVLYTDGAMNNTPHDIIRGAIHHWQPEVITQFAIRQSQRPDNASVILVQFF